MLHYNIVYLLLNNMLRSYCFVLLAGMALSWAVVANEKPQSKEISILASIKPVKLIAQAIAGEQQTVEVLVPTGMSIHDYALRPSDFKKIRDADLVIWLGPVTEPYLGKVLKQAGAKKEHGKSLNVGISSASSIRAAEPPHVWLSVANAGHIARRLTDRLTLLHPAGSEQYRRNLADFLDKLAQLDAELKIKLAQGSSRYLVYHNAYPLFEAEYGLAHAGVISDHHEVKPGAKHLLHLRHIVEKQDIGCIIVEPGSNLSVVNLVVQDFDIRLIELDPMAADIPPGTGAYLNFIREVGEGFGQCTGGFTEK